MNSNVFLFPITIYLFVYSIIATYAFWLMLYRLRYLGQRLSTSKADISKLETAYETLRSLLERTGKNQAEALSIIAEANKRIDRLEDKRTYKPKAQAPKATPRTPRPLQGKSAKQQPYPCGDQHQINDRDRNLLTAGENER